MKIAVALLVLLVLFLPNTYPHDYTRMSLPEGAVARFGKGQVREVLYSPDGARLAVRGSIGIWLYDTTSYQEVALLVGHTDWLFADAMFSPDGKTIAHRSPDGKMLLWDAGTGQPKEGTLIGGKRVRSVLFSPDGKTLARAGIPVQLWDVKTGNLRRTLTGHTAHGSLVFSLDGKVLASASPGDDGTLWVWDTETGELKHTFTEHTGWIVKIVFSPDSTVLASAAKIPDTTVRVWDVKTGEQKQILATYLDHSDLIFSPDGVTLAAKGEENEWQLWDATTGERKWTLTPKGQNISICVAFSPNGATLASANGPFDTTVRLWDVKTGEQKQVLTEHTQGVHSLAFSPDGTTLVSGGWDHTVRLWDAVTGEHKQVLAGHTQIISSLVFGADGRTLASGDSDGTMRLWDVKTGEQKRGLIGRGDMIKVAALSPDGTTYATKSALLRDTTVHLWDAVTSEQKGVLTEHTKPVYGRSVQSGRQHGCQRKRGQDGAVVGCRDG